MWLPPQRLRVNMGSFSFGSFLASLVAFPPDAGRVPGGSGILIMTVYSVSFHAMK